MCCVEILLSHNFCIYTTKFTYGAVIQLVKRRANLEKEIDLKLKDLHDNHEKERERLDADYEAKKQKLNDDYRQYVSVLFFIYYFYF